MPVQEYVSIAFSADSIYLAAQGGTPEWNLTVWQWEKSKLTGIAKGVTQVRLELIRSLNSMRPTVANAESMHIFDSNARC